MRNNDDAPRAIQEALENGDVEAWNNWANANVTLVPVDMDQLQILFHITRLNGKGITVKAKKESRKFLTDMGLYKESAPPSIDMTEVLSAMQTGTRLFDNEKDLSKAVGIVVLIYQSESKLLSGFNKLTAAIGKNIDKAGSSVVFRTLRTVSGSVFRFVMEDDDPTELVAELSDQQFGYRIFTQ